MLQLCLFFNARKFHGSQRPPEARWRNQKEGLQGGPETEWDQLRKSQGQWAEREVVRKVGDSQAGSH